MSRGTTIRHAVIMAAGRGNRMRPLSDVLPKAMMPYRGGTLIGNSLSMLRRCVDHVHVTVGYKRAMLARYLMARGVDSVLNTEGHGNAWWIRHTLLRYLDEPVLVLTTDNVTELDIDFLFHQYEGARRPPCLLVPVVPIPGVEGDYIEHEDGVVTSLQRDSPTDIYCSGIQILNPSRVAALAPEGDSFADVWQTLIAARALRVSAVYPKPWFSVDTLEHLSELGSVAPTPRGSREP